MPKKSLKIRETFHFSFFDDFFFLLSEHEAYQELETEIATIKSHLFEETELMSLIESISVSLQHLDALLTGYEIDPSTTDLNSLSDHLRSDYDRLEMLNESKSLSKVKREKYSVKVDYLNALYADLLLRLQKLQKGCDHSVQVINHYIIYLGAKIQIFRK